MNFTTYNRDEIKPGILHFGVGGFHRAHQANYLNQLMSQGEAKEWGLCGVGVQIVQDVRPYELMKLRLLNASHQALAHWGRLLGHTYAHEAATDPDLAEFVRTFLNQEARATLEAVSGIDVDEYVDTLFERFATPAIQDTLARLATDASERMPKFVLPTAWDLSAAGNSKFLDYQAIFGELGGNPAFASAFDSVLQDLRSRNAREVLREPNAKS